MDRFGDEVEVDDLDVDLDLDLEGEGEGEGDPREGVLDLVVTMFVDINCV